MASSGSVFSETLHSITSTKLEELSKKREAFEEQYSALQAASRLEQDPLRRLFILVDGVKSCFSVKTGSKIRDGSGRERLGRVISGTTGNPRLEMDLGNLDRFFEQARFDPSVSPRILHEWERNLLQHLSVQSVKYQYATLYGQLVTEWLSSEKKLNTPSDDDMEISEVFEDLPGAKKLESRAAWERSVFEPYETDRAALEMYLENLFGKRPDDKKDVFRAFKAIQYSVEDFETTLAKPKQFNNSTLTWTIRGLLASGLLSDEKRAVLKNFLGNDIILSEMADVLNMRLTALPTWTWGGDVFIEQRRRLNGTYDIHLHEDVLQAIFLQFIGVKWSVFFKKALRKFRTHERAWKSPCKVVPHLDQKRREYYLGPQQNALSVQSKRRRIYEKNYFLSQLPDSEVQETEIDEGDEEAEVKEIQLLTVQQARGPTARGVTRRQRAQRYSSRADAGRSRSPDEGDSDDEGQTRPKRPMDAKQGLLHLLSTEISINTRLHGEFTCVRSVFDQWNPLLPHATILTVLKFFGVSQKWLRFFQKFLQAPLKFIDESSAASRIRKRGTPGSHALSGLFGEVILFCLDFSVNQSTDGGLLHRMHDDFWFWSPDHPKCVTAWKTVRDFAKVMGVSLNEAKTGTVRIGGDKGEVLKIDPSLPHGQIRWGFLYLDPTSRRFEIDQDMIDSHIKELRNQLQSKTMSVFGWIQTWNTYATTFFTTNFGKPANCFGREHVDKILATHERIHRTIFSSNESVVGYLKGILKERFGVNDVLDGFLFFPVELGGLGLSSPFIGPLQVRDAVLANPSNSLDCFEDAEEDAYRSAKQRFEKGESRYRRYDLRDPDWEPPDGKDVFMSFEEFTRYREEYDYGYRDQLLDVFDELLKQPAEESIQADAKVLNALSALNGQANLKGILSYWAGMVPYWKWVAQLYGPDIIDRFGGFNIVDPTLLPIGMVSLFRDKRVKWEG